MPEECRGPVVCLLLGKQKGSRQRSDIGEARLDYLMTVRDMTARSSRRIWISPSRRSLVLRALNPERALVLSTISTIIEEMNYESWRGLSADRTRRRYRGRQGVCAG